MVYLRELNCSDVNENYLSWMNDSEITKYLEVRFRQFSIDDLIKFVNETKKSDTNYLFGIFLKESNKHIGNMKIGDINKFHHFADVGLLIGDKKEWGKGYATLAIKEACKIAFNDLNLYKLKSGMYENNLGSYRAFLKVGFKEVGRYKNHWICGEKREDEILLELLKEDFHE
ncbi:MAG: GNAT family N-acetyltransferase [Campylobacterales bacterium]|nr:GNAT family N-acetyltransferase [Campylobacterales bacterium]